jgi:hypothetical protein
LALTFQASFAFRLDKRSSKGLSDLKPEKYTRGEAEIIEMDGEAEDGYYEGETEDEDQEAIQQEMHANDVIETEDEDEAAIESELHANDQTETEGALLENDMAGMTMRVATSAEKKVFMNMHNKYRCMHGVPSVTWNSAMAADAEKWVVRNGYKHSNSYDLKAPGGPAGENLAKSSGSLTAARAVTLWYNEVNDCKTGSATTFTDGCAAPKSGKMTGHLTALIWKGAKSIGCAFSRTTRPTVVICRYKSGERKDTNTPNMNKAQGNYKKHVFPRKKTESQCGR